MASSRLCCCITCGLPASGKTNLCKLIQELATVQTTLRGKSIAVIHICYDDIIPEINMDSGLKQDHTLWKEYRRTILECLDYIFKELTESDILLNQAAEQLQQHGHRIRSEIHGDESRDMVQLRDSVWSRVFRCLSAAAKTEEAERKDDDGVLFLIDDNMFYRSMRYEYFQLARKYTSGFCQLGLECSMKTAMDRNSQRIHGIPEETMATMADKLELPDASKAPWEKNSILIDAHVLVDHAVLAPVWMLIQSAFESPVPPLQEEDTEAKDQSRAECAASVLHQADQALRKGISELMAEGKGKLNGQELKDLAIQLSMSKTAILEGVRGGHLVPPPLPQGGEPRQDFHVFFRDCLTNKMKR